MGHFPQVFRWDERPSTDYEDQEGMSIHPQREADLVPPQAPPAHGGPLETETLWRFHF